MNIPMAKRTVGPETVQVNGPQATPAEVPKPVAGAFGTEEAKAIGNFGDAIQTLGVAMTRIAKKRIEWKNDVQMADLNNKYISDTLDMLHNDRTIIRGEKGSEQEIPDGILDRTGYGAIGASDEFVEREFAIRSGILSQIKDQSNRTEFEQKLTSHFLNLKESVIEHEVKQHRSADAETYVSLNKNLILTAGTASDPRVLSGIIDNITLNNKKLANRMGLDEQTEKLNTSVDVSKAVENASMTTLKITGDYARAQSLLDTAKDKIPENEYRDITDQLKAYDAKMAEEARVRKIKYQHDQESSALDVWAADLDKPVADRMLTPQKLKEGHKSGDYSDDFFKSMMNNLLGREKTQADAETLKAKNKQESEMIDSLRKNTLTEEQVNLARDREIDPIDADFALQMVRAIRTQKSSEPTPEDKDNAYIEFTNRAAQIVEEDATLEQIMKFRSDILDAHNAKRIDSSDAQKWLKDTQGTLDKGLDHVVDSAIAKAKPRKFLEALWNRKDIQKYESRRPGMKARMTKHLMSRIRAGEDPAIAIDAVVRNEILLMNPDIINYSKEGQLAMDDDGNLGIIYPDGSSKPLDTKPETAAPKEGK